MHRLVAELACKVDVVVSQLNRVLFQHWLGPEQAEQDASASWNNVVLSVKQACAVEFQHSVDAHRMHVLSVASACIVAVVATHVCVVVFQQLSGP